jgi:hypothetical protein
VSNIRLARTGAGLALVIGGLVGGVIGGVIGGVTVATALSRPAVTNATYYACLKDGLLSKISVSNETCKKGHRLIDWNQTGPEGPQGVPGIQGIQGNPGNSYNLPAGAGYLCPNGSELISSGETVSDGYDTTVSECLFPHS